MLKNTIFKFDLAVKLSHFAELVGGSQHFVKFSNLIFEASLRRGQFSDLT